MKEAKPKISINKLMEFRTATPWRQREIVDNQKNPGVNKPKMAWCATAKKYIIQFIADGCKDEDILNQGIAVVHEKINTINELEHNEKKRARKIKVAEVDIAAIDSFRNLHHTLNIKGFFFSKPLQKAQAFNFAGVDVSIRPEIVVRTKNWENIGCVKLYLTKNNRLNDEDADLLCATLNQYTVTRLSPHKSANPKACMVIDVFGQKVFTSHDSVFSATQLKKCCEEVCKLWPTIPTRKPINGDEEDEFNFPE